MLSKKLLLLALVIFILPLFVNANQTNINQPYTTDGSTIALYHQDNGTLVTDSSGNGHTLTNSGVDNTSGGKFDYAGDYERGDGSDRLSVVDHNDFDITGSFTLEGWFKPEGAFDPALSYKMLMKDNGTGGFHNYWISMYDGEITCDYGISGLYRGVTSDTNYVIAGWTTDWKHIACIHDADADTLAIYVNAVQDGNVTNATESPIATDGDFVIGHTNAGATGWDGIIDEVRLSNSVRVLVSGASGSNPDVNWTYPSSDMDFHEDIKDEWDLNFVFSDSDAGALTDYNFTIWWGATQGAETTEIVSGADVNTYCSGTPATSVSCSYDFNVVGASSEDTAFFTVEVFDEVNDDSTKEENSDSVHLNQWITSLAIPDLGSTNYVTDNGENKGYVRYNRFTTPQDQYIAFSDNTLKVGNNWQESGAFNELWRGSRGFVKFDISDLGNVTDGEFSAYISGVDGTVIGWLYQIDDYGAVDTSDYNDYSSGAQLTTSFFDSSDDDSTVTYDVNTVLNTAIDDGDNYIAFVIRTKCDGEADDQSCVSWDKNADLTSVKLTYTVSGTTVTTTQWFTGFADYTRDYDSANVLDASCDVDVNDTDIAWIQSDTLTYDAVDTRYEKDYIIQDSGDFIATYTCSKAGYDSANDTDTFTISESTPSPSLTANFTTSETGNNVDVDEEFEFLGLTFEDDYETVVNDAECVTYVDSNTTQLSMDWSNPNIRYEVDHSYGSAGSELAYLGCSSEDFGEVFKALTVSVDGEDTTIDITEPDEPLEMYEAFWIYADFEDDEGTDVTGGDATCILDAGDGEGNRTMDYDAGNSYYEYYLDTGYTTYGDKDYTITCSKTDYDNAEGTGDLEVIIGDGNIGVQCITNCSYALDENEIYIIPTDNTDGVDFRITNNTLLNYDLNIVIRNALNDKNMYYIETGTDGETWAHDLTLTKEINPIWDDTLSLWGHTWTETLLGGGETYYRTEYDAPAYYLADTSFASSSDWTVLNGTENWNTTNTNCGYGCSELIGSPISDIRVISSGQTIQGGTVLKFTAWSTVDGASGTVKGLYSDDLTDATYSDTITLTTSPKTYYFQNTQDQNTTDAERNNMIWELEFASLSEATTVYLDEPNFYQPEYIIAPLDFLKLNKDPIQVWIEVGTESYRRLWEAEPFLISTEIRDPLGDIDDESVTIEIDHDANSVITTILDTDYTATDGINYYRINGIIDYASNKDTTPDRLLKAKLTVTDYMGVGYQETAWVTLEQFPNDVNDWILHTQEEARARNVHPEGRIYGRVEIPKALAYLEMIICQDDNGQDSLMYPNSCESNNDDLEHYLFYPNESYETDFTLDGQGYFDFRYKLPDWKYYTDGNYSTFVKMNFITQSFDDTYSRQIYQIGVVGATAGGEILNAEDFGGTPTVTQTQDVKVAGWFSSDLGLDLKNYLDPRFRVMDSGGTNPVSLYFYPDSIGWDVANRRNAFYFDTPLYDENGVQLVDGTSYVLRIEVYDSSKMHSVSLITGDINFDVNNTAEPLEADEVKFSKGQISSVSRAGIGKDGYNVTWGALLGLNNFTVNQYEVTFMTDNSEEAFDLSDKDNQAVTVKVPFDVIMANGYLENCYEYDVYSMTPFKSGMNSNYDICVNEIYDNLDASSNAWDYINPLYVLDRNVKFIQANTCTYAKTGIDWGATWGNTPDNVTDVSAWTVTNLNSFFGDFYSDVNRTATDSMSSYCYPLMISVENLDYYNYEDTLERCSTEFSGYEDEINSKNLISKMYEYDCELNKDDLEIRIGDKSYTSPNYLVATDDFYEGDGKYLPLQMKFRVFTDNFKNATLIYKNLSFQDFSGANQDPFKVWEGIFMDSFVEYFWLWLMVIGGIVLMAIAQKKGITIIGRS